MAGELTKEEAAWISKVNAVLRKCPSSRLGFYTIGDDTLFVWDVTMKDAVFDALDDRSASEFASAVILANADFDEQLRFPNPVESTAG